MNAESRDWLYANGYRAAGAPRIWFDRDGHRIGGDEKMVDHLVSVVLAAEQRRSNRQAIVATWCAECFGDDQAASIPQRGLRLAEEAIEAAQAAHVPADKLHALVDYIYARPAGALAQEMGGVGVTLLALASAAEVNADDTEAAEVKRILEKPREHFTQRNAAKNAAGFIVAGA